MSRSNNQVAPYHICKTSMPHVPIIHISDWSAFNLMEKVVEIEISILPQVVGQLVEVGLIRKTELWNAINKIGRRA